MTKPHSHCGRHREESRAETKLEGLFPVPTSPAPKGVTEEEAEGRVLASLRKRGYGVAEERDFPHPREVFVPLTKLVEGI